MKRIDIGIIGGGLSGLTTAYELYQRLGDTANITIIEKESQLGGRIFTKKFQECPIELGAQFFIHDGKMHQLIRSLNLELDVIPLNDNFISFYYNQNIYSREQVQSSSLFTPKGKAETEKLLMYSNKIVPHEDIIFCSFEEWYKKNIGTELLSFWNRMLMSIGVRDIQSINAYFGLILIHVFFGKNYLLKTGLQEVINSLDNKIMVSGGKILKGLECISIEKKENKYILQFNKSSIKNELIFDNIVSAVPPKELCEILKNDICKDLQKIEGHPMALYVIETNIKLWDKTWGLIVCEEKSPIYALCDWKNVMKASKKTPLLAICSPFVKSDAILSEIQKLFPKVHLNGKVIFEKKWEVGLHQANKEFFTIPKKILCNIPQQLYVAGDWTILPALEGAIISGTKAVQSFIGDVK
jgi:protoporphyrinogen oxidase